MIFFFLLMLCRSSSLQEEGIERVSSFSDETKGI
jgi:hypothetical protein